MLRLTGYRQVWPSAKPLYIYGAASVLTTRYGGAVVALGVGAQKLAGKEERREQHGVAFCPVTTVFPAQDFAQRTVLDNPTALSPKYFRSCGTTVGITTPTALSPKYFRSCLP